MLLEPTVILGAGEIGAELATASPNHPEYGVATVGFLDCVTGRGLPFPLLGDVGELDRILTEHDVSRVSWPSARPGSPSWSASCGPWSLTTPRCSSSRGSSTAGSPPTGPDTDDVRGIPLYRVRRAALRAPAWYLKRVLDVVVAGAVLVLRCPCSSSAPSPVKISSPGPVLFRQRRIGQGGREIHVLKLRDAPGQPRQRHAVVGGRRSPPRPGRFPPAPDLDGRAPAAVEGAQGDMTLVGPRPERPFFVRQLHRGRRRLQRSPPGPGRAHRLGPGPRLARRHLHRGAGPLRQPATSSTGRCGGTSSC